MDIAELWLIKRWAEATVSGMEKEKKRCPRQKYRQARKKCEKKLVAFF